MRLFLSVGFVAVLFVSTTVYAAPSGAVLVAHFQAMRDEARNVAPDAPLYVKSSVDEDRPSADVYSLIDRPYSHFAAALSNPAVWCDFVSLNLNVKACTYHDDPLALTFYVGRKEYQAPEDAYRLTYRFQDRIRNDHYLRLVLGADTGPMGTSDYRIVLEAADFRGATLVRIRSSYVQSWRSAMATSVYLATLGRNKVGFTVTGTDSAGAPQYVGGVQGIIERNAMRYYLALQAYLETRVVLPVNERFLAGARRWFELTESYPRQLHELERGEYLDAKRRERANQQRLQARIGGKRAAIARK